MKTSPSFVWTLQRCNALLWQWGASSTLGAGWKRFSEVGMIYRTQTPSMRYRYSIRMDASPLAGWENFYVIVGSSAGALIGLQFVVITLIADLPIGRGAEQAGEAFATPTIVHFGTVLLLSAILNAPWHGIHAAAVCWGITGVAGLVYAAIILRRVRRQTAYQPQFEDWLFHLLLPIAAYAMLTGSAGAATTNPRSALFVVAAASLLLLFVGIHNAWDAVTYHVFVQKRRQQEKERERQIAVSPLVDNKK